MRFIFSIISPLIDILYKEIENSSYLYQLSKQLFNSLLRGEKSGRYIRLPFFYVVFFDGTSLPPGRHH